MKKILKDRDLRMDFEGQLYDKPVPNHPPPYRTFPELHTAGAPTAKAKDEPKLHPHGDDLTSDASLRHKLGRIHYFAGNSLTNAEVATIINQKLGSPTVGSALYARQLRVQSNKLQSSIFAVGGGDSAGPNHLTWLGGYVSTAAAATPGLTEELGTLPDPRVQLQGSSTQS